MKLASNRDLQLEAGLVYALVGDQVQAEKITIDLRKKFPSDTIVNAYWLPVIAGTLALRQGNAAQAVSSLEHTTTYELTASLAAGILISIQQRGQAYLKLHDGNAAIGEFQRMMQHHCLMVNRVQSALARLDLARAYAMAGDQQKYRTAYQDFLTLWKDADPDVPVLVQAKAEFARMQ